MSEIKTITNKSTAKGGVEKFANFDLRFAENTGEARIVKHGIQKIVLVSSLVILSGCGDKWCARL